MSHVDPLAGMAQALRESRTGEHRDSDRTRDRILATAASLPKRRKTVVWLIPIAAVLIISSAAATTAGRRVFERYVERYLGGAPFDEARHVAGRGRDDANAARPPNVVTPSDAVAPPDVVAPPEVVAPSNTGASRNTVAVETAGGRPKGIARRSVAPDKRPARSTASLEESPQTESTPPPAPAVAANDDGNRLYDAAHELHFVRHDAAAALAAWDVYLRERPDGPFAPEAHYNRALCLVRLARFAEARAALRPFRDGYFGPYRQREASRLIDAMADK
jgi:hypothetical protein